MHIRIDEAIKSVLIVEDEGIVAMLMEDLMRDLGARDIYVCADVDSALEIARSKDLDCAILDLHIRGGSGADVADVLTERDIPFVFSTGSDMTQMLARYADRPVINKPFADDDLKLIVLDTWSVARSTGPTLLSAASA